MGQPWAHARHRPTQTFLWPIWKTNYSTTVQTTSNPLSGNRYIDDIFVVWTHGEESLHTFINHLNTSHPTIKFEHEYSHSNIHFLDTTVTLTQQGTLVTSLYTKPTDRTLLLHNKSHHPIHCKTRGNLQPSPTIQTHHHTRRGVFKQTRQTENNPPYKGLQR